MENSTTISAGGMKIHVRENNVVSFFTSGHLWTGSIGQLEAILESHQLLKDACQQMVSAGFYTNEKDEISNAITSAQEALRRAD